jgi:serine/threonine protein kinase
MPEPTKTLTSFLDASLQSVGLGPCLSEDEILAFVQGDVPDVKHERIHAHVDECDVCQHLVAEAAHAIDTEPTVESERPSWNTVFQRNTVVAKRYRVLRLIARGGMGEVYEVYDSALQERVALKTVTSTACDSAQAMRLLKAEVQHARRISHPNVCRIYDLGSHIIESTGAEIQFLVMEFVEGEVLGKKLRESGALPIELAQSIARQLLQGLRAAHQAGTLHRDFKSDNVILKTDANGRITPVILDFGLAKALNESGHQATTHTQNHAMVGTIGYMAPEQIEGEPLSRASDLYAFGVVWYEMLTGHLPFAGGSIAASAVARLHRDAEPPSSVTSHIPKSLDDIVLRCLSRQPKDRYGSAEEILEALANAADAPQSQSPVTLRTRKKLVSPLLVVMGLSVTVGGWFWIKVPTLSAPVQSQFEANVFGSKSSKNAPEVIIPEPVEPPVVGQPVATSPSIVPPVVGQPVATSTTSEPQSGAKPTVPVKESTRKPLSGSGAQSKSDKATNKNSLPPPPPVATNHVTSGEPIADSGKPDWIRPKALKAGLGAK